MKFADVSKLVRGPFGGALKKEIFVTSGYKVYEQQHAIYGDFNAGEYFIDEENYNRLKRFALQPGDIIMSCSGTAGRFAIFPPNANPGVINQALLKVCPQKRIITINFLYYFLNSQYFKRNLFADFAGGAIKNIAGMPIIKKIPIPIPPLPEQKKIAEILSAWDRAIEQVGKLIDTKQRLKKGLMQQLLSGKLRFPEFAGSEKLKTKSEKVGKGKLPEGWEESELGLLFKRVTRKNSTGVEHVLTASGEHGLVDQRDYFNRSVASKSLDGYYCLKRGEYAYNRSAMQGYPYGAIKRLNDYEVGVLSTLYLCFAFCSQENCSDFFMHYFESGLLNRQLRGIVQVGARAHGLLNVSTRDFFALKIPVPSEAEQIRIAAVLSTCDREIELLKKKQEKLKEQKKGLMQKLLTGEIRHPEFLKLKVKN